MLRYIQGKNSTAEEKENGKYISCHVGKLSKALRL